MGLDLRLPNITGTTEKEQLAQIKSYLYQFAQQLQWAMNTIDTPSVSNQVTSQVPQKVIVQSKEENAEATFNSLKALIIKSADIVEAYYDVINKKLVGVYVAESDFGTFVENTTNNIESTSTYTEQKFNDVQTIITNKVDGLKSAFGEDMDSLNTSFSTALDASQTKTAEDIQNLLDQVGDKIDKSINELNYAIIEATAHIRSGILYYDNNSLPVYGLEIGQKNTVDGVEVFKKFARFTADRLSFYDQNNTEVAYISDYKLYIRNVEITVSFKIGGFIDTVESNGNVVTKWVGGEG